MFELLAATGIMSYLESPLVPGLVCLLLIYFLLLRPQSKRQKEMDHWLANVSRGDEVVTSGGLWGRIHEAEKGSPFVILELQDKIRVKMLRSSLVGKPPEASSNAKDTKEKDQKKE